MASQFAEIGGFERFTSDRAQYEMSTGLLEVGGFYRIISAVTLVVAIERRLPVLTALRMPKQS